LKNVIIFADEITEAQHELFHYTKIRAYTFKEVCEMGRFEKNRRPEEPKPDDVMLLSYTSGTTGNPKGVKITHKMMVGVGHALQTRIPLGKKFSEQDCYISYLPSAHVFEQACFMLTLVYGIKVGFYSGNILALTKDLEILKPTFVPAVPRLLNSIYGKIKDKMAKEEGLRKSLIDWAVKSKLSDLKKGRGLKSTVADTLVFNKIK
jgi:long-chain acyl-CoA synthetase